MKKLHLLLLSVTLCVFSACHNEIWDAIDGLDSRVTKLEELCKEMNTNITSLQTIVDVLQSNDFITSIVEIKKDGKVVGYTITFGKHDPITIYHGQDGKDGQNGQNGADGKDGQDGQNGADGKDGITPVIGVAQDTDGVYYWTLNGEWLLDDNGNKLPVSGTNGKDGQNGSNGQDGTDGKDGQDGTDGKDGQDGTDGKDGVTPQLKIEEGYWYISYDNGATWTQLGKATGEDGKDGADGEDGKDGADGENGKDGQNGADGKDGQDGDSMFQSVTQDDNYVYFTLADGTVIKIAKGSASNDQPNSEFIFTITYNPNGGDGVMKKDTFYYGKANSIKRCEFEKKDCFFTTWNTRSDGTGISYKADWTLTIDKNVILYAQWNEIDWQDLGLSVKWAPVNLGALRPEEYGDYFAWGEVKAKSRFHESTYKVLNDYNRNNGLTTLTSEDDAAMVNWNRSGRMPTKSEWDELLANCTCTWITQNGVNGCKVTSKINGNSIFLPATGSYVADGSNNIYIGSSGYYWSSSLDRTYINSNAWGVKFSSSQIDFVSWGRAAGFSIRPVCP